MQSTDEGAKKGARFAVAMIGSGNAIESGAVVTGTFSSLRVRSHQSPCLQPGFPWKELSLGTTVCDVGGGIGTIMMQLAHSYPHLQLTLQDLPERVMQAQNEIWPERCPEALKEGRIEFKAMDFFAESPIKGCDIYYVRSTAIL